MCHLRLKTRTGICLLLIALSSRAARGQHENHDRQSTHHVLLGHVTFPNSGKAAAQKPFLTGLALLHSFEYGEAADSFRVAQKIDPDFALAYWMEGLTNTKLIWGLEDRAAALAAFSRLAPTTEARLAKARTARERAFGSAVEAFYKEGPTQSRVRAFADSMRKWATVMPDDLEAHAFAALGIIWQASFVRNEAADSLNREAVQHAQFVFDRNPQHPGAAHYIIHASDSPAGAARGLKAARAYSKIAPDASHALHMPSHIFLPLGMWDDLVLSNERAWKATRSELAETGAPLWENDWHSLNWLQYAYLQLGRWKDAHALIDTARALTADVGGLKNPADDPDAVYAVEALAFRYGAETGDWSAFPADTVAISVVDTTISNRARGFAASSLYQRGIIASLRGDTAGAQRAMSSLRTIAPPLADGVRLSLYLNKADTASAIALLDRMRPTLRVDRYSSMTPGSTINASEQFGDLLTSTGRASDAIQVYRDALADWPMRAHSLLGLAQAQAVAGDRKGAARTRDELSKIWIKADPAVRAMLERSASTQSSARAVTPLPPALRSGATIVRLDRAFRPYVIRQGSNNMVCIDDAPTDDEFDVRCYRDTFIPVVYRAFQLGYSVAGPKVRDEILAGKLKLSKEPTAGYRCLGPAAGYDERSGKIDERIECWQSVHFPFKTAAEIGFPEEKDVPEKEQYTTPYVMESGGYWSHVMLRHPPGR